MTRLIILLLLLGTLALPTLAQSGSGVMNEGIVAVVNDSVITESDFENRYKLGLISSNLPDEPQMRERLKPQVLRALIDEQLQLQEAKRLDITVKPEEITAAQQKIATENNIMGDIRDYIKSRGASPTALDDQIRAGIAWSKVVARTLRPRVEVGDDEVDDAIEKMQANAGKQEYQVSEIFLANDNPADDSQVEVFASKLRQQIEQGAPFPVLARQFSQGTGAMQGGDLGWVQEGQLAKEIDQALQTASKGQVIGPVKTSLGFHLLLVRDMRTLEAGNPEDANAHLLQLLLPITPTRDRAQTLKTALEVRETLAGCPDTLKRMTVDPNWNVLDMGKQKFDELPAWLAGIARNQAINGVSGPVPISNGTALFMVCERSAPKGPDRTAIMSMIGMERLENLARRQLRELKRSAYIDVRG